MALMASLLAFKKFFCSVSLVQKRILKVDGVPLVSS